MKGVGVETRGAAFQFYEFFLDIFGFDFFEFFARDFFIKNIIFLMPEANASDTVPASDTVVTVL